LARAIAGTSRIGKKEPPATAAQLSRRVTRRRGRKQQDHIRTLRDGEIGQEEGPATEKEALLHTLD
jgi:hypothetical protein